MIDLPAVSAALRRLGFAAALSGAALSFAPAANADPATDTALKMFVSAIDNSPDWAATSAGITTDASGASVLTGLKITSTVPGMTISVDTIAVTKGTATIDGKYTATKVTAGNITISTGPLTVTLANVSLDDFQAPAGIAFAYNATQPFTSIAHAYAALAKTHLGGAHVASLVLNETLATTTSRVTYNDVTLARLDAGRITTLSAGPMTSESPIPDKLNPKPLVGITTAHADAKNIDLGALLRIYDAPAANGARTFQPAVSNVTYRDTTVAIPGITLKLGTMSLDDLRIRPPEHPIAADLDKAVSAPFADPAVTSDPAGMLNLLSAYSVGQLTVTPIDVTATGIDTLHFDGMSIANLSLDGLGDFSLTGFSGGVKDIGVSLKAGKIAFGGIVFPKTDAVEAAYKTAVSGGNPDLSGITPTLGYVEFGALDANIAGYPETKLGKLRLDFANNVGFVPTSIKVDLQGADLDASLIPFVREQLVHYGYTRLVADASGQIVWNEAKKTTQVTGLKLTAKDVGTITIDATLAGPTRADIEGLGTPSALPTFGDKLSLVSGTLSFKDDSIVGRVLADQATAVKVDPDKFRDQFARSLPLMMLPIGSGDFQKKATPVFADFIRTPGTVTFTAAPAMPLGIPALIKAVSSSGLFNLPTLLNLTVTGVPGTKPPAAPAPSPSPTPAPVVAPPAAPAGGDIRGTVQPPK